MSALMFLMWPKALIQVYISNDGLGDLPGFVAQLASSFFAGASSHPCGKPVQVNRRIVRPHHPEDVGGHIVARFLHKALKVSQRVPTSFDNNHWIRQPSVTS